MASIGTIYAWFRDGVRVSVIYSEVRDAQEAFTQGAVLMESKNGGATWAVVEDV